MSSSGIVIGARDSENFRGAAYLYTPTGESQTKLLAPDGEALDF